MYDGIAGRTEHSVKGGGIDFQFLSKVPQYLSVSSGIQQLRSSLSAVEHEDQEGPTLTSSTFRKAGLYCAVCYTQTRGASIMIPGRCQCPGNWTTEYFGYLSAERGGHISPSTYICIDNNLVPKSKVNPYGSTTMKVEMKCHNTHICPPYEEGKELTCAVCTK